MTTISIIVFASAIFLAAGLNLTIENRFRKLVMSVMGAGAVVFGLTIYGYGYSQVGIPAPVAVVRTIMAVCAMFGGSNDWGGISGVAFYKQSWIMVVFWLVHFAAFYATASAAITAIGSKLIRKIRLALIRRGTLLIVYGTNADALEYGKRQISALGRSVVFVGQGDNALETAINTAGGVLDRNSENPDIKLLRRLGIRPGKRPIEIAALHEDASRNLAYAKKLLAVFETAGINHEQTRLLVRDADEDQASALIFSGGKYGYGSVMAFNEYEIAARLMVQEMPPCDTITFDEHGCAGNNFSVLMIGFGRMGRAALDELLKNGQFAGSTFRADIFDPNAQNGTLFDHEILMQYDIRFHKADGRSSEFYSFLSEHRDDVRYIVLCTGSGKENMEIAGDIGKWLEERGILPAIVQCTSHGLTFTRPGGTETVHRSIYGSDALDLERIDRMAMAINHMYYRESGKSPRENWKVCDYFSRMSCRASADFYPAMLKAAARNADQVENGNWPPREDVLENLAITEHMRWCAFHYTMGFRLMRDEEFEKRCDQYSRDMRKKGSSSVRISKDMETRTHACLIPWEGLDALSEKENAATGKHVDYKQMDRDNVLALPEILEVLSEMPDD